MRGRSGVDSGLSKRILDFVGGTEWRFLSLEEKYDVKGLKLLG